MNSAGGFPSSGTLFRPAHFHDASCLLGTRRIVPTNKAVQQLTQVKGHSVLMSQTAPAKGRAVPELNLRKLRGSGYDMLKEKVCTALSGILGEGVDVHRCAAARALGAIGSPAIYDPLIKALLDEDSDVRTDAASALRKLSDSRSADALMNSLIGDPCSEVKLAAITALVGLRHQPVVPWLRRLAVGRDEEVAWDDEEFYGGAWDDWLDIQIAAIRGIADLGAEDGVTEIVTAFEDEMGQDISAHVIGALLRLGKPGGKALDELFSNGDTQLRRSIAAALRGINVGASVEALRKRCLADESAEVRLAALTSLIQADPNDERIEAFFDDNDAGIRKTVIELAGARYPTAVRRRLEDINPKVRRAAFAVVAESPEPFVDEGITDILRRSVSAKTGVPSEALVAWARVEPGGALPALAYALKLSGRPLGFRRGVVRALACIGAPAIEHLTLAAGDNERQIRLDALTALANEARTAGTWPNEAGEVLLATLAGELVLAPKKDSDVAEPEIAGNDEIAALDQTNVERPQSSNDQSDENKARAAVVVSADDEHQADEVELRATDIAGYVVGETDRGPVSTLQAILSGRDDMEPSAEASPEVELTDRDLEFMALSERRAIKKTKISLDASSIAPDQDVRRFAARLLGDIHQQAIVTPLIDALDHGDRELSHAALESLAEIGDGLTNLPQETVDAFETILAGGDTEARIFAIRALVFVNSPRINEILQELMADENAHIRLEVIRALDARDEIGTGIAKFLKDENTGVRIATAKAMAAHCGCDAVEPLIDFAFFADGTHRREAGQLLADLAPEQAASRFLEILADKSRAREWLVAIEALDEIAVHLDWEKELAAV